MSERVAELQRQIEQLQEQLAEARRGVPRESVSDYELTRSNGESVRLSELFGDRDDLILIHNMGRGCTYCTLWADGFVSMLPYITQRAAFVLSTPDAPEVQSAFAAERSWPFAMVSTRGSSLTRDLGYEHDGSYEPGFSALHRNPDGTIVRTGQDSFGPGDVYAPIWHFFSALDGGDRGWEPSGNPYAGAARG